MDKKVYNKIKLQYIKEKDIIIFQQLRNGIMGQTMNLQGKGGQQDFGCDLSIVAEGCRI